MAMVMKQHVDSRLLRMDRGLLASSWGWGASRSDKHTHGEREQVERQTVSQLICVLTMRGVIK